MAGRAAPSEDRTRVTPTRVLSGSSLALVALVALVEAVFTNATNADFRHLRVLCARAEGPGTRPRPRARLRTSDYPPLPSSILASSNRSVGSPWFSQMRWYLDRLSVSKPTR